MRKQRVAVVGGGLSGLSAAHRLKELDPALEVLLFEAGDRLGGAVRTEERDGFLVEHGGDMFITDKPWGVALCERLGIADRLIAPNARYRRSLVLSKGKPEPVPQGFMLMAPARVMPFLRSRVISPLGKLRAAADMLIRKRFDDGCDESIAAFVRRRMGDEMLDRLVQPLVGGIYTGDPERLSLRATLPRFIDMEREHGSLVVGSMRKAEQAARNGSGARYGMFVSFPRGLGELIDALSATIDADVRLGGVVTAVDAGGVEVDGERIACDAVVLALPTHAAAKLIKNAELVALLGDIPYASSAVVVSGHRLDDIAHPLDAFGLVVPAIENREVLAVSFASRKFDGRAPDGSVLLRTFVGGVLQHDVYQRSDDDILAIVERELHSMIGVRGEPQFALVVRYHAAMPQYEVGHLTRVARIESALQSEPWLSLAGNGFYGVGIPDVIASGEKAAERAFAAIFK